MRKIAFVILVVVFFGCHGGDDGTGVEPNAVTASTVSSATAGVCGSANASNVTSAPSSGLCSAGTASSVSGDADGSYTWSCQGDGGGATAYCSAGPCPGSSSAFNVYMAPGGRDSNDGLTPDQAVKTLSRVQTIVRAAAPTSAVNVNIQGGTYYNDSNSGGTDTTVAWNFFIESQPINFIPYGSGAPYFLGCADGTFSTDGCVPPNYFFRAYQSNSQTSTKDQIDGNLQFCGLYVEGYQNGVDLYSDVAGYSYASINHNTIKKSHFRYIGNGFPFNNSTSSDWYSSGVISVTASSNNEFSDNEFYENTTIISPHNTPSYIHSFYVGHHSNNNLITRNTFNYVSGTPISIRNGSNANTITYNTFSNIGDSGYDIAAVMDWYWSGGNECPSYGNTFDDNTINSVASDFGSDTACLAFIGDTPYGCSSSANSATVSGCSVPSNLAYRFYYSGNSGGIF